MTSVLGVALLGLALLASTTVSHPVSREDGTCSYEDITREALMLPVTEACRAMAEAAGHEFQPTSSSPDELVQACMGSTATGLVPGAKFHSALQDIYLQNALVDLDLADSEPHDFHWEAFGQGLHTLQDFHSHGDWMELGNKDPHITLIRPDLPLENLAGKGSHGGASDQTSTTVPRGGINKDEGHFEQLTTASVQLLEEIRLAAGDNDFLRTMGIGRSSAVCFVIDTTGSMSDAMAEVKATAHQLIDSKTGTQDEPAEYILVPFNDPDFGPAIRTSDPDEMKAEISKLNPNGGGGDRPEMMNMSGLQLALTTAPPSSYIYVFTDAEAKDTELKNMIMALIMETKSTVSPILIGHGPVSRWGRRPSPTAAGIDYYHDIAVTSGGQIIHGRGG